MYFSFINCERHTELLIVLRSVFQLDEEQVLQLLWRGVRRQVDQHGVPFLQEGIKMLLKTHIVQTTVVIKVSVMT